MNAPATTSGVSQDLRSIPDLMMDYLINTSHTATSADLKAFAIANGRLAKSVPPCMVDLFRQGFVIREKVGREFIYSATSQPYNFGITKLVRNREVDVSRKSPVTVKRDEVLIVLQVQGRKVECNLEEARRIYTQLGRLFGVRSNGD